MWTSEAYPSGGMTMYDNWYVIQVRSGKEEEIRETCQHLIPQGIYEDCFIPKCKRMKNIEENGKRLKKSYLGAMFL